MPDLTTEAGIKVYLDSGKFPFCVKVLKIERLPEGVVGYVYRVYVEHAEHSSIIVKHAAACTAREPWFEVDPSRMLYEYRAMHYMSQPDIQSSPHIRIPRVLHYDGTAHLLVMEDAGDLPSLKRWFKPGICSKTGVKIGEALGTFLAKLHTQTRGAAAVLDKFEGNDSARALSSEAFFGGLPQAAVKFGYTDEFIVEVAETSKIDVMESREVLTHGDFWTSNILITPSGDEHEDLQLTVLDFELSKPGYAAYDIGQMSAELFFLAFFRDDQLGSQMLNSFLRTYRKYAEGPIAADKVAIRAGAHILFIAPIAWTSEGSQDRLREVGRIGFELVRAGWEKDLEALRKSIVGPLM